MFRDGEFLSGVLPVFELVVALLKGFELDLLALGAQVGPKGEARYHLLENFDHGFAVDGFQFTLNTDLSNKPFLNFVLRVGAVRVVAARVAYLPGDFLPSLAVRVDP